MQAAKDDASPARALVAGIAAFTTWGIVPIYWKLLRQIPAPEILAHRFVWTILFLAALLTLQKRWREIFATFTRGVPLFTASAAES